MRAESKGANAWLLERWTPVRHGGWRRTAAALAVTETVSWGVLYYAFAVFLAPTTAESGWTTAQVSAAFSIAVLVSGLAAPLVGRWIDRRGPRGIMTAGSALGAALVAGWAFADGIAAFYAVWALLGVAMAATLYEPAFAAIARYRPDQRRAALVTITFAAALASTIFSPLSNLLLQHHGRQRALVILAALLAVITVPVHRFALPGAPASAPGPLRRPEPPAQDHSPDAPRRGGFARIVAAFALSKATGAGVTAHVVAFLIVQGSTAGAAAAVAGAIGVAKIAGRIAAGAALRRVDAATVGAVALATQCGALMLPIALRGLAGVVGFVALFGAASGGATILRPELVAQRYGTGSFGSRNGVAEMAATVAGAAAPVGAGLAVGASGSYTAAWIALAAASGVAACVLLSVRPGART